MGLFPIGKIMAQQLSAPSFIYGTDGANPNFHWANYSWVYLFAALIGFSTTIAEPSLLAVPIKANEVSLRWHYQAAGIKSCGGSWG